MKSHLLILGLILTATPLIAQNGKSYPPTLPGSTEHVYKKIGDVPLRLYAYNPKDPVAADRRPAIVFFFGGGWRSGSPTQFLHHCQYLASRGMVAITADYRVSSRHQSQAKDSVADAKSAIRWVREHARELGIDPNRIAAGGGSAGGHLAACTSIITGFEEASENAAISSVPNAMALFNPAVVLAPIKALPMDAPRVAELTERMGVEPRQLSPYHHVRAGQPPTIIFHGMADTTVPYLTVEAFTQAMQKAGNRCELVGRPKAPHGYFNWGKEANKPFRETVLAMDRFFVSLEWIRGEPGVDDYLITHGPKTPK